MCSSLTGKEKRHPSAEAAFGLPADDQLSEDRKQLAKYLFRTFSGPEGLCRWSRKAAMTMINNNSLRFDVLYAPSNGLRDLLMHVSVNQHKTCFSSKEVLSYTLAYMALHKERLVYHLDPEICKSDSLLRKALHIPVFHRNRLTKLLAQELTALVKKPNLEFYSTMQPMPTGTSDLPSTNMSMVKPMVQIRYKPARVQRLTRAAVKWENQALSEYRTKAKPKRPLGKNAVKRPPMPAMGNPQIKLKRLEIAQIGANNLAVISSCSPNLGFWTLSTDDLKP